jgi:hypothetical protein
MIDPIREHDLEVWGHLVEGYSAWMNASKEFFAEGVDRVALVRRALRDGKGKFAAIQVLRSLKTQELQSLFDDLVEWSSTGHGTVHVFREAILSLPRQWVLSRIEGVAEPLLRDGTYDEYRRFLELFIELDRDLALRLARRAAAHPDADIREAGSDFLAILDEPTDPPEGVGAKRTGGETPIASREPRTEG